MSLEGKTVVLFGAGAIASGYAPMFADEASNVVVVSRGESSEKLAQELRSRDGAESNAAITVMHADASDFAQVGRVYDDVVKQFGKVDVVVKT